MCRDQLLSEATCVQAIHQPNATVTTNIHVKIGKCASYSSESVYYRTEQESVSHASRGPCFNNFMECSLQTCYKQYTIFNFLIKLQNVLQMAGALSPEGENSLLYISCLRQSVKVVQSKALCPGGQTLEANGDN